MQRFIRGGLVLGALMWSSIAWAIVKEAAVSVNSAGAPLAGATILIKPAARPVVSTVQRPATPRVAAPQATSRSDARGVYTLRYDDELHRGMLFDVTITTRDGQRRTLPGVSIEQILAGLDVASPGGTPSVASPLGGAGPGSPFSGPSIDFSVSGGENFVELPDRGFIARELQGSGVPELNQIRPSTRATGPGAQFKININDAPTPASRIFFTFNYFNVKADSGGTFDPGSNFRLNLAGAQGGATGVSIGGNPLNQVTSLFFENETENFGGSAGIRLPILNTLGTGNSVDAVVGVSGNRLTMRESFGGQIPGFGRDFLYTTNVNVNSAQLDLGLGVTQIVRPAGPGIVILFHGDITVSPTALWANGTDHFSFTGIAPSAADLDENKIDVGFSANAGLSFGLPGSTVSANRINGPSIFVKGGYESRPGFPVIERDGSNPSRVELKRADIFTISGGVAIPFNTNGRN